jgi:peptide/nickel transport system substrate-binding protein
MEVIKQQLEATGAIQVTLQAQEWSTYVTACTGGEAYPICVLGWFYDYPDASNYMEPFIYNGGQGSMVTTAAEGSDYGLPLNDQAQQLLDLMTASDVETDIPTRAALLDEAQNVYADMVVTIPLFLNPEYMVFRDYISGMSNLDNPDSLNVGGTIEFSYSVLSKKP